MSGVIFRGHSVSVQVSACDSLYRTIVDRRCLQTSVGPAFVAILGNKYGYRPFPAHIEQSEFDKLLACLESDGADSSTLREHFRLDLNSVPASYVLQASKADDSQWSQQYEMMQKLLRDAAMKILTPHDAQKYCISVTEAEIHRGVIDNAARVTQVHLANSIVTAVNN